MESINYIQDQEVVANQTIWDMFAINETVAMIAIAISIISGVITLMIAESNDRSRFMGFITGFFLGVLGITIYAVIGESVELRVEKEEDARADYRKASLRQSRKEASNA